MVWNIFEMRHTLVRYFIFSAAIVLALTGVAKLFSAAGSAKILLLEDPVFRIHFRLLFSIAGTIECAVAVACFLIDQVAPRALLLAWLASTIALYRMGFWWVGYHKACSCLGNLTDDLHVSPQIADMAMKVVLAYLLTGSYAILFRHWWQSRKASSLPPHLQPN